MTIWQNILLIVLLICFSAFFSSSETALFSLNKMRLDKMAEEGKKSAKVAKYLCEHSKTTLSGLLIGNNLVNIAASSLMTVVVLGLIPHNTALAGTVATLTITVLVLVFAEITPKIVAKKKALSIACYVAYPLFAIAMVLFLPITAIVLGFVNVLSKLWRNKKNNTPTMTEDEFVTMIETAEEEDVLDEEQSDLLQSAIDFSDTTVEDILVPRINMEAFDIEDTYEEVMALATETGYSRLVVYEETVDHVIGVLSLNRLFRAVAQKQGKVDIRTLLVEPYFVHKTMKLPALLSVMRSHQLQLAIVLDEYGGTMGIVTMEDILEEIVGDIWDETDDIETEIVATGDGIYHVDGLTNIYDFFAHIDMDERDFESEYTTMGGWAIEMLDADPHVGDSFSYRNLYVIVTEMSENVVTGLSVQLKEEQEEEE